MPPEEWVDEAEVRGAPGPGFRAGDGNGGEGRAFILEASTVIVRRDLKHPTAGPAAPLLRCAGEEGPGEGMGPHLPGLLLELPGEGVPVGGGRVPPQRGSAPRAVFPRQEACGATPQVGPTVASNPYSYPNSTRKSCNALAASSLSASICLAVTAYLPHRFSTAATQAR